jgi:hypothetical protein
MKLQLRYEPVSKQEIAAAFIRGSDLKSWLNVINAFRVTPREIECYVMPASVQTVEPAGLFVIFSGNEKADEVLLLEAYTKLGEKLFIPFNTTLYPAVTNTELDKLLVWEYQVFHPSIGLVGFDKKERLNFEELIACGVSENADWSFAHPGLPVRPALTQILVQQPGMEEIMQAFKDAVNAKPLSDIPKSKDESSNILNKALDELKWVLFKGLFAAAAFTEKFISKGTGSNDRSGISGKPGLIQDLKQWLMQNITDLEKKRSEELNRLLKMFDENTDEALKYAIPLDSPYLNRGSAQKSTNLTKRFVNFNLGNLGGGYMVDGWDVGHHYNDLRSKYLKAAQKEIEQKDFRKAAYVYAHLLGDYNAAANVLEQGKFYREAAALHKDHFKNTTAAAECLERGGLYHEAIPLFEEVNRFEKVGDLYTILQQKENADSYYQKTLDIKITNNDYLDAARIADEKMLNRENAKNILLAGWDGHNQSEQCLNKYFDIVNSNETDKTSQSVHDIYRHRTPVSKRPVFLNVLNRVNQKSNAEDAVAYRDIAYEIVSDEASKGNMLLVHNLKQFIKEDKLVGSDCNRYANASKVKSINVKAEHFLHLDSSIKWINAISHRNQFIAIGLKNDFLHMARANWYGNIEYYSWANPVKQRTRFTFINAPYYTNQIILHSSEGLPVTRKNLPRNKYFNDPLVVNCPIWMHKDNGQIIINERQEVCKLEIKDGSATLHYYTLDGDLKKSVNCVFSNISKPPGLRQSTPLMISRDSYFYTYLDKYFIVVSASGKAKTFPFDTIIRMFAASVDFLQFNLLISTNKGCLLCKPNYENLEIQGGFFATDLIPYSVQFVAEDKFLIIEKKKAVLFYINDTNVVLTKEFHTQEIIVAALPSARSEFGLLEENGRITICKME